MAKKRSILVFFIFFLIFLVFFMSSSFFKLTEVEISFYDNQYKNNVNLNENQVYNNHANIEQLKLLAKEDVGKSLFLINKNKYFNKFESQNPYAKLFEVKTKYPNKLVFCISERKQCYFIRSQNLFFILDTEFKILKITKSIETQNLIEICLKNKNFTNIDFFEFFNVSTYAFVEGQFLSENNLILQSILNIKNIFLNSFIEFSFIKSICFEEFNDQINLIIFTDKEYGASFKIENVLNNLDLKLEQILLEFKKSLNQNDQIKICFGVYSVGDDLKISWNNL